MTGGAVSTRQLTALRICLRSAAGSLMSAFLSAASTRSRKTLWSSKSVSPSASRSFVATSTRRPSRSQVLASSSFFFFFSGRPFFVLPPSSSSPSSSSLPQSARRFSSAAEILAKLVKSVLAELLVERGAQVFVAGGEAQRLDGLERELAVQAQRALDRHLPVAERGVGEDLRLGRFLEVEEGAADALDVLGRELAVLLAEVLAQRLEPLAGVDELHLALAVLGLPVGQHPDVGGDAGVVEEVERQGDDGLEPVVLDEPAADVALALARVAGEQRPAVVDLGDAAAERRVAVHLRRHVGEEEHLAVAGAGDERQLFALVHHLEARVAHAVLAAHRLEVLLPALPVGRIGEHEVELLGGEGVVRERGPFRAADDVVGALAFAFEQHVRLADGVSLGVDLLAVEEALICCLRLAAIAVSVSSATVSMPPVPQAQS